MTAPNGKAGDDRSAVIRGDIERTRGDMSRTVNAIEERLSPAHIKEQVASVTASVTSDVEKKVSDEITHARAAVREATVGRVEHMVHDARDSVTDAGTTVLDTIKENPIPAALVGVGLGWLIFGARSRTGSSGRGMRRYRPDGGERYGYGAGYGGYGYAEGRDEGASNVGHRVQEGASNVGHRVQEGATHLVEGAQTVAHDAGQRVAEVAGDAREAAMHLAGDARMRGQRVVRGAGRGIRRAERGVERSLRENPLALGAIAVAIGAAIGLSLPHTEVEDEWMGDAKDRLVHKAESAAGEAIQKAEETVGQLTSGEKGSGKDRPGKDQQDGTPDTAKNGVSNGRSGSSQAV